jgi:Amt family ammonium transporter
LVSRSEAGCADTAWMIVATALVLMMTIPGLPLFYSGMVRKKNVLATMAQSLSAVAMISILWVAFGYSSATVHGLERSIAGCSPA